MKNLIKLIRIYICALKNEIYIDNYTLKNLLGKKTDLNYTPVRPLKSIVYLDKYKINKYIYIILNIIFLFLFPIIFLKDLFKFSVLILIKLNTKKHIKCKIAFITNRRGKELVKNACKCSDIEYVNIMKDRDIVEYLGIFDVVKAYLLSIISVYASIAYISLINFLQNYISFRWFLIYFLAHKLSKHVNYVYITQHYDRWAILFDNAFIKNKLILIQHGIIKEDINPPCKLKNVDIVFLIKKEFEKNFKNFIENYKTKYCTINYKLRLRDFKKPQNKKSILIVGQPHSAKNELLIIEKILSKYKDKVYIILKPHPLYGLKNYYSEILKEIHIINEKDFFPKVDLVLCYESTLGLEYEAERVKVIWWKKEDIKNGNLLKIVEELISK